MKEPPEWVREGADRPGVMEDAWIEAEDLVANIRIYDDRAVTVEVRNQDDDIVFYSEVYDE